jgi:hypothetical protein
MFAFNFKSALKTTAQGKFMKRILLSLLLLNAAQSADVVTVDPFGVTTVAGTTPATAPATGEVKLGGGNIWTTGSIKAGSLGLTSASDAVNLTTGSFSTVGGGSFAKNLYSGSFFVTTGAAYGQGGHLFHVASADTNPRLGIYNYGAMLWGPGNTGADTNLYRDAVGSLKTDSSFTCNKLSVLNNASVGGAISASSVIINGKAPGQAGGIAMLDSSGKIPAERLPDAAGLGLPQGYQAFTTPGIYSFDIPANTKIIYACVIGGAGGAGGSKPPGSYGSIWCPGGKGGDGGKLMTRINVVAGLTTIEVRVGGFGIGGVGGGGSGESSYANKNTTGGGGGGGGSQLIYNGLTFTAGGGGGGGGSKNGYTGFSNRAGNGGAAMAAGETVPSYGNAGGAGAAMHTTLNGGLGGTGGSASNNLGQPGTNGNSGGFSDHPFWFLFSPSELGTLGQGGQPNTTSPTEGTRGGSGNPGAIILRW